jgi:hypothetical protein
MFRKSTSSPLQDSFGLLLSSDVPNTVENDKLKSIYKWKDLQKQWALLNLYISEEDKPKIETIMKKPPSLQEWLGSTNPIIHGRSILDIEKEALEEAENFAKHELAKTVSTDTMIDKYEILKNKNGTNRWEAGKKEDEKKEDEKNEQTMDFLRRQGNLRQHYRPVPPRLVKKQSKVVSPLKLTNTQWKVKYMKRLFKMMESEIINMLENDD